jgi:DNA mismatch repair protein MutS
LKEVESVVLNAETKINQLEYELFVEIRNFIQGYIGAIQRTSSAISVLDVLVSYAEVSSRLGYVKPAMNGGDAIVIEKGRHPVIEGSIRNGIFVSNDTYVDRDDSSLLLITGPNMSGKSTYMRQTALIVLMAQTGCFVPAEAATIGIVDRIYTRIGASDNLAQGQSTFYVEMSELAYILNTATDRSLIILDEIGRGTSTYDGLSIAWAVVEYLCSSKGRIRTLFATHYHELTALEGHMRGLKNLNVDVQEKDGNIVFLHKIVEGSASRSYGIHVAKLAGVPQQLLLTAEDKLKELEKSGASIDLDKYVSAEKEEEVNLKADTEQISFFGFAPNPVVERLKALDLMNITPSQAFGILEELKKAAEN